MTTSDSRPTQPVGAYSDFDHNDGSLTAVDFRRRHDAMREQCPVAHSNKHGGFDILTRYEDIRTVLSRADEFSSADGVLIPQTGLPPVAAMEFDDPEHARWRRLMEPPLTVRAVRDFEPVIVELVDELIDEFADAGVADLVPDLSEPLPSIVVGRIVGLDREEALEGRTVASRLFSALGSPEFSDRNSEFSQFVEARLADRRQHPRDDFLSQLAAGSVDGVPVDDASVASLMVAYVVGGHHSTGSGIGGLLRDILTNHELRTSIENDPKVLARAVDESLRLNTPLQYFARSALADTTAGGCPIAQGSRVLVDLAAANRDPRVFTDPDEFRTDRKRNPHIAFGSGRHVCLGQHLARAEMRIVASRLLARLPDLTLVDDVEETVVAGKLLTVTQLPVRFTPANAGTPLPQ